MSSGPPLSPTLGPALARAGLQLHTVLTLTTSMGRERGFHQFHSPIIECHWLSLSHMTIPDPIPVALGL